MDPAALGQYLRFALDELSTRNGQFEFEALCQQLIRGRVASNLITASGPVAAKGDQGRDAETYISTLRDELGPHSTFLALQQNEMAAVCCTLQRDSLKSKFTEDAEKVVASGAPVKRIYAMCSTAVAVGVRHDIENSISEALDGIEVQLFDAVWIAEQLSDPDLFWVAERYLQLDGTVRPPDGGATNDGLEDWYVEARGRWRDAENPSGSVGDFYELRAALREAKEPGPARPDLPMWLERMQSLLLQVADEELAMEVRYELSVCTLIGLRDLRPADHHAKAFFEAVMESDHPFRLSDAQNLLWFVFGMIGAGRSAIEPEELADWAVRLRGHLASLMESDPSPTRLAFYRFATGRLLVQVRPELIEVPEQELDLPEIDVIREATNGPAFGPEDLVDAAGAVAIWLDLVGDLGDGALFPVEPLSRTLSMMAGVLCGVDGWEELTAAVDERLAAEAGQDAAASAAFDRAFSMAEANRPLEAIDQLHSAKGAWFAGASMRKSIHALLTLSSAYLEVNLPAAAKMFALAGAYAAGSTGQDDVIDLLPDALAKAARADFFAGRWFAASRTCEAQITVSAEQTPSSRIFGAPENVDEDVLEVVSMIRTILAAGRDLGPGYDAALASFASGLSDAADGQELLGPRRDSEEWRANLEEFGVLDAPFADARATAPVRFSALGISWKIRATDAESVVAAERLAAAASVLSADLHDRDLCLIAGTVEVDVTATERQAGEALAADDVITGTPGDDGRWTLLLGIGETWLLAPQQVSAELFSILAAIFNERSLLPLAQLEAELQAAARDGALGNLFAARAYDELVASLLGEFALPVSDVDPPWTLDPDPDPGLAWRAGPGPTYDAEKARRDLQSRYEKLPRMCRATLPRLVADEATRSVLLSLREEGWLDWQILQAIHGIIVRWRQPSIPDTLSRQEVEALLLSPEDETLEPVPLEQFSAENLRSAAEGGIIATLQVLGLELHSPKPDVEAIRALLVARYAYATDDIAHEDPLHI